MDLPLKPNILEDISKDVGPLEILSLGKIKALTKFYSIGLPPHPLEKSTPTPSMTKSCWKMNPAGYA